MIIRVPIIKEMEARQCKCCNGDPVFDEKIEPFSVYCTKCFARGPVTNNSTEAVDGWNKLME